MVSNVMQGFHSDTSYSNLQDGLNFFKDSGSNVGTNRNKRALVEIPASTEFYQLRTKNFSTGGIEASSSFPVLKGATVIVGAMSAVLAFNTMDYVADTIPRMFQIISSSEAGIDYASMKFSKAKERLAKLSEKVAGWKGLNSQALADDVYKAATDFFESYYSIGNMKEPFIGLDSDGDITLFWKDDDLVLDMSITNDGTYSYYAKLKDGSSFAKDDESVKQVFPQALLAAMIVI